MITNTNRNWPFHMAIVGSASLKGFVVVDQFKSLDFGSRHVKFIENAPIPVLDDVMALADSILFQ